MCSKTHWGDFFFFIPLNFEGFYFLWNGLQFISNCELLFVVFTSRDDIRSVSLCVCQHAQMYMWRYVACFKFKWTFILRTRKISHLKGLLRLGHQLILNVSPWEFSDWNNRSLIINWFQLLDSWWVECKLL